MKLDTKETILGIPILNIRNILRKRQSFAVIFLMQQLNLNRRKAQQLLEEMVRLEYITKSSAEKGLYSLSIKGNALRMSKAVKPLSREKAEELLSSFMERVEEVNANEFYLYQIEEISLFGSFISESDFVNDIDIVVSISKKDMDSLVWKDKCFQKIKEAKESGKKFNHLLDELYFPEREVRLFLLSKSPYLSIHPPDDLILKQTRTIRVYPLNGGRDERK